MGPRGDAFTDSIPGERLHVGSRPSLSSLTGDRPHQSGATGETDRQRPSQAAASPGHSGWMHDLEVQALWRCHPSGEDGQVPEPLREQVSSTATPMAPREYAGASMTHKEGYWIHSEPTAQIQQSAILYTELEESDDAS